MPFKSETDFSSHSDFCGIIHVHVPADLRNIDEDIIPRMKGESSLQHKLGHLGLERSALESHRASQPQTESDKHGELVEEEQRAGAEDPEETFVGMEAVED